MKKVILFIVALMSVASINAQNIIDRIVVNASQLGAVIAESGRSVQVIDASEIANSPVTSLDELLRHTVGVHANTRNAFGVQSDIGMRGATFSQVLILIDGVRFNDPLTAHFNNNFPLTLNDIDRVEIIKGPAATSFGADAVGGVIHVKSKAYTGNYKQGFATKGQMGFGQHNLFSTDLGASYASNKTYFSLGYKANNAYGEEHINPNTPATSSMVDFYNNYFKVHTVSGAGAVSLTDTWRAFGRATFDYRDFSAKYFYTRSSFDESTEQTNSFWSQVGLKNKTAVSETEVMASHKSTDDVFVFNPLFAANSHTTTQQSLRAQHKRNIGNSSILLGAQTTKRDIESTDRGNHQDNNKAAYIETSIRAKEQLVINGGIRVENDDNFGTEWLPQLALAYQTGSVNWRASVGKSIRAADYTERYISSQIPNLTPGRNRGNQDLVAEKAWSYDVGTTINIPRGPGGGSSNNFQIGIDGFYRNSTNLIDYVITNSANINNASNLQPNSDYFFASNLSKTNTKGIEFFTNSPLLGNTTHSVRAHLNYAFLNTNSEDDAVSKYLANHPKHNANFTIETNLNSLRVHFASQYLVRDAEQVNSINGNIKPNYFLVHAKAQKELVPGAALFLQAHNLLDTQYQEILGAPLPGRWLMAGFNWNVAE